MELDQYFSERLDDQIKWYDNKSKINQRWYKTLKVMQIILSFSLPVVIGFGSDTSLWKVIDSGIGVLVAIITGISEIVGYHENWLNYRSTAEALKHEKYLFLTGCDPYNSEGSYQKNVSKAEGLTAKENQRWRKNDMNHKEDQYGKEKNIH